MDDESIERRLAAQAGVISRAQVLAAGGDDNDIERRMRSRWWARVHPGVYVDHTGPLSWSQRAWAAVLLHSPAALTGSSSLRAHGLLPHDDGVIEVAVAHTRRVDDPPGVRTSRLRAFERVTQQRRSPPRTRVEHAALVVASRSRTDDAAVAVLADAVQQRHTTAARLRAELELLGRLPRRAFLAEVVADVHDGARSAMERHYLRDVERAHGLPTGIRQVRAALRGIVYRDVLYDDHHTIVELDGRLGHEKQVDVWDDLDRDVDAAVDGLLTVHVGWRQVLNPCRLALAVGRILEARGWTGEVQPCGPTCLVGAPADRGGSPASGAGDPPRSAA